MRGTVMTVIGVVAAATMMAATGGAAWGGSSQGFPALKGGFGVTAYLVAPTEGMDGKTPEGWKKITSLSYGNAALADECLTPDKGAGTILTTSYALPKADYRVSVLVRGNGKVRLLGSDQWKSIEEADRTRANSYKWFEVGTVKGAEKVAVEVAPAEGGPTFYYGGVLAEGTVMPVNPVSKVLEKLKAGGPATVVLLGDSVTENAGGTGGGSSSFEKGNPGLMLAFLKQYGDVDYLTHRSPKDWPADRKNNLDQIKRATIGGTECFDSRIELDASKKIHLVNLGKGGAAADWGWSRMPDTVFDNDYLDKEHESVRYGLGHYKPDLVIINFGTNDVNGSKGPQWSPEQYLFSMKVLATNIQQRFGAAVVLSTPHKWTAGTHLANHFQPQIVDLLRAYCRETGLALADVYSEYEPGEYDGIHPRDAGHRHIADAYAKAILGEPSESKIKARITAADLKDNGDGTVTDKTTGLVWTKNADLGGGPKSKEDAEAIIAELNKQKPGGRDQWRLPTREELLGLVDPAERPALPKGSPFEKAGGWTLTSPGGWGVDMQTGIPYGPTGSVKNRVGMVWAVCGAAAPAN